MMSGTDRTIRCHYYNILEHVRAAMGGDPALHSQQNL